MVAPARTTEEILTTLRTVKYPGFSRDLVSFGVVKDVRLDGADVSLELQVPTQDPEVIAKIRTAVREALAALPGIGEIRVRAGARPTTPYPGRLPSRG